MRRATLLLSCAWILWGNVDGTWGIMNAHEHFQACDTELNARMAAWTTPERQALGWQRVGPNVVRQGAGRLMQLACLPDTMKP